MQPYTLPKGSAVILQEKGTLVVLFQSFTRSANHVMQRAREESKELGHGYVGPEHVLIALAKVPSPAKVALERIGMHEDRIRDYTVDVVGDFFIEEVTAYAPLTPMLRAILGGVHLLAAHDGGSYVGVEHLLLALHTTSGCDNNHARVILSKHGIDIALLREEVDRAVSEAEEAAQHDTVPDDGIPLLREDAVPLLCGTDCACFLVA